jgi:radical SAM protein with 4Fe4S-binding SPASM domain
MHNLVDTPLGKLLGLEKRGASFLGRVAALCLHKPQVLRTFLYEGYRNLLGVDLDRRFHPGQSGLPIEIVLDLTRRCNLKCRMCTQIRHSDDIPDRLSWYDPRRELPLAAWVELLEQVKSFRPRLHLTGGEPMVYPQFKELVQEIKKRRFFMRLTTNGTLLAGKADFLVASGVEVVVVSLDGPPEFHDRIRGQEGIFARATAGFRALAAQRDKFGGYEPLLVINCTISRANLPVLDQMVPIAQELGADILQFHHTIFDWPANVAKHNRLLSPERSRKWGLDLAFPSISEHEYYQSEIRPADIPVLVDRLKEARRVAKGRLNLIFVPNLPLELIEPYYLDLDYPFAPICKRLWKSCRIYPDGTIAPCFHAMVGNIRERPFLELWNNPKMQRLREIINRGLLPGCARCCSRRFTGGSRDGQRGEPKAG